MPVEEEIDLNFISDEQLEKIEKQAEKLERAANKASSAKQTLQGISPTFGIGGAEEFPDTSPQQVGVVTPDVVLPSKGRRVAQGIARSPVATLTVDELQNKVSLMEEETDKIKIKQKEHDDFIRKLLSTQQEVSSDVSQVFSAIHDPFNFIKSKAFQQLGKLGISAGAIIGIASTVMDFISEQFKPGGIWDLRKMVLEEVREFMELEVIDALNRGELYLGDVTYLASREPSGATTTKRGSFAHINDLLDHRGN